MASFKEGALQLRRRNIAAPSDPGFIKVYCDIGGSLYTVDEYGTSAYIKGVANISTGIFGALPTFSIDNLSATIGSCNIILNSNSDYSGTYNAYTLSGDSIALIDNYNLQYVSIKIIDGQPKLYIESTYSNINGSNQVCLYMVYKDVFDNTWNYLSYGATGSGLPNKILDSLVDSNNFRIASLGTPKLEEVSNRNITVSACSVMFGITKINIPKFDSRNDNLYQYTKNSGVWTSQHVTQYDNTNYNGPAGPMLMNIGKYSVRWFYTVVDSYPQVYYTLGTSAYDSIAQAQMEDPPDYLPVALASTSFLIGRIIIGQCANSGLVEGAFGKFPFKPMSSNHNSLDGLQGGTYGEYYHLTSSEHNQLTSGGYTNLHTHDYVYNQSTASTMWAINHNLNRLTTVSVYSGGQMVEPAVAYTDYNTTIITFSVATTGYAIFA